MKILALIVMLIVGMGRVGVNSQPNQGCLQICHDRIAKLLANGTIPPMGYCSYCNPQL